MIVEWQRRGAPLISSVGAATELLRPAHDIPDASVLSKAAGLFCFGQHHVPMSAAKAAMSGLKHPPAISAISK
jgi:hypothetical protein